MISRINMIQALQGILLLFLLTTHSLVDSNVDHSAVSSTVSAASSAKSNPCDRKWPSLDLLLPHRIHTNTQDPKYYEFEAIFLRSFMLFWPLKISNTSLTVLIDAELSTTPQAKELYTTIEGFRHQVPGGAKLDVIPTSHYYRHGYDRQQLAMFWADNYTTAEYVGFVDTDAAFITYVDLEDLFEDGKPVVNGKSGYHPVAKDGIWRWTSGSYLSLGILEPLRCMSYFPVIVKTSHLKELREYVERYHNQSFNEVFFSNITNGDGYSQFHIMCTFLFTFHRDEYKWYVHSETPKWDGINPPPIFGQDGNQTQFTAEMRLPKPRIATHVGYRRCPQNPIPNIRKRMEMNLFLQNGVCMSPPFPRPEPVCHSPNRSVVVEGYYYEMHTFEYVDYALVNDPVVLKREYEKRMKRIVSCDHDWWDKSEMGIIMKPLGKMTGGGWE